MRPRAASSRLLFAGLAALTLAAAAPAAAKPRWTRAQLEERVRNELLRDGLSLARLGYFLEATPAESGRWIVTLDTGAGEPKVRVLDGLPVELDAAAAEVVLVVEQMLGRATRTRATVPDAPPEGRVTLPDVSSPRDRRILAYARERARVVRSDEVKLKASFWGRSVRGKVETRYALTIGKDTVGHWEFAQKLAELSEEPVDPEMQRLYAPRIKRWKGLLIPGYIVGGIGTVGGLATLVSSNACDTSSIRYEPTACRNDRIIGGVSLFVGAGILAGAVLYHVNSEKALHRDAPYFSFDELTILVDRYNRRLRRRLGLDDAIDESLEREGTRPADLTVEARPPEPPSTSPWPTVTVAPRFAALTWSF